MPFPLPEAPFPSLPVYLSFGSQLHLDFQQQWLIPQCFSASSKTERSPPQSVFRTPPWCHLSPWAAQGERLACWSPLPHQPQVQEALPNICRMEGSQCSALHDGTINGYFVAQSCPTLCDPINHSTPGSCVRGDPPGKNTGVGCHALLQGIFPTQGSNSGFPHCRWILYCLSQFICLDLSLRQRVLSVAYFYIYLWTKFLTHNFFHMIPQI